MKNNCFESAFKSKGYLLKLCYSLHIIIVRKTLYIFYPVYYRLYYPKIGIKFDKKIGKGNHYKLN